MKTRTLRLPVFFKAARANFLISSLIPAAIAAGVAAYLNAAAAWVLFPVILFGVACLHFFVNLVNEYFDFRRGVDLPAKYDRVHPLASGEVSAGQVLIFMILTFALGFGCLVILSFYRGFLLFVLGVLGFAGGYSYTGPPLAYKYRGAGEIMILLFMGPLLGSGIYLALTGELSFVAIAASLPPGLLITAVLISNNIRDIDKDRAAGIKTMPIRTGLEKASYIYASVLFSVFIWIIIMAVLGYYPLLSLISLIFIPAAVKYSKILKKREKHLDTIDLKTLQIYAGVNTIIAFSFFLGALM